MKNTIKTLIVSLAVVFISNTSLADDLPKTKVEKRIEQANKGDPRDQFMVGFMYYMGNGVTQDYKEAFSWMLKGAEQGHANSQHRVGVMYDKGYGVTQDKTKAKEWFSKSCDNGQQKSCDKLKN